jgi:hypothetical protein
MDRRIWLCICALTMGSLAHSRPIVFARSATIMADYREGALSEAQLFYAPTHYLSFGVGRADLSNDFMPASHSVTYARLNLLVHRWNMEEAQANFFVWGGAGAAYVGEYTALATAPSAPPSEHDHGGPPPPSAGGLVRALNGFSYHAGGQVDFETRRFYSSFKTDFFDSNLFWHRADTLQFGISPYKHGVDSLAAWLIVSGRKYSGDMHEGEELALLLRFFKKASWIEAGATTDGKIQAMAMFSF